MRKKEEHIFGNILYMCRALKVGYLGLEFPDRGAWPWVSEWATGVSKELILSSALRLSF